MPSNAHYSFWELGFEAILGFSLATPSHLVSTLVEPTVEGDRDWEGASGNIPIGCAILLEEKIRKALKRANTDILPGCGANVLLAGVKTAIPPISSC